MLGEILENTRLMSSRIRRLEAEIDRNNDRRLFDPDISPEDAYEAIAKMVSEGMPPDIIVKRLSGRVPISEIRKMLIDSIKLSSSNEKV